MSGDVAATAGVLVGQLPLAPLVLVDREATIQHVARVMIANGLSAGLVGGEDAIVSEHDVVDALASGLGLGDGSIQADQQCVE